MELMDLFAKLPITAEQLQSLLGLRSVLSLLSGIPHLAYNLAIYVLTALPIFVIARRRKLAMPWLAWIPVLRGWTLGSIADQYREQAHGQVRFRRRVLLWISLAAAAIGTVVLILLGTLLARLFVHLAQLGAISSAHLSQALLDLVEPAMGMLLLILPLLALHVVRVVFHYIALYDLYLSCDPDNAVLYLVLGIFFRFCQPIFLMLCRNKDNGLRPTGAETPAP